MNKTNKKIYNKKILKKIKKISNKLNILKKMENNQNATASTLAINVIPPEKLTIILNDFITKTITHLNKLSINVEDKFQSFDQKLDEKSAT